MARPSCTPAVGGREDYRHRGSVDAAVSEGWTGITYDENGRDHNASVIVWWTHLGVCPECNAEGVDDE